MSPGQQFGVMIAPSGALAWGLALLGVGPAAAAAGAGAGALAGFAGGWFYGRLLARAERARPRRQPWLAAFGLLVALWLVLVILPAVLGTGAGGLLPRARLRLPVG
jgi:hypothetical protein